MTVNSEKRYHKNKNNLAKTILLQEKITKSLKSFENNRILKITINKNFNKLYKLIKNSKSCNCNKVFLDLNNSPITNEIVIKLINSMKTSIIVYNMRYVCLSKL